MPTSRGGLDTTSCQEAGVGAGRNAGSWPWNARSKQGLVWDAARCIHTAICHKTVSVLIKDRLLHCTHVRLLSAAAGIESQAR